VAPVERAVSVSWDPAAAFHRFTAQFADWWPRATHSIGGKRVKRVVFECREGGRIIEELNDGRRFQWGRVTAWDPPRRVGFSWHPSRDEREAQDVVVTFAAEGSGTLVTLTSTGWERLGAKASTARRMYGLGWGSVLARYAGRRSAAIGVFAALSGVATFVLKLTGRLDAAIDRAGGRLPETEP
jgi:uncharacterized protein YndB with AHSA1/START domain